MKHYFIGIDLGGTKILAGLVDESFNLISEIKLPTEALKGKNQSLANIYRAIETLLDRHNLSFEHIMHIGIGVPGPVDHKTGTVKICPNIPGWQNLPIKQILEEKYQTNVCVENDARVAGLAEARKGVAKGYEHVFYATISTGVGGAIIINSRIYHGADGIAGEIGQTRLLDGSVFEKNTAGPALKNIFHIAPEDLIKQLKSGNTQAEKALNHLINHTGIWLANVATLLNPEIIVIGGGLSNLGPHYLIPLTKMIKANAFSTSSQVKVTKAKLGDKAGLIGALELCR